MCIGGAAPRDAPDRGVLLDRVAVSIHPRPSTQGGAWTTPLHACRPRRREPILAVFASRRMHDRAQAELLMLSRSLAIFALSTSLREALWLSAEDPDPPLRAPPFLSASFSHAESFIL